jgi:hypothetical protein
MNAIYYECVKKKNSKNLVEVEPTTLSLLVHCSTIFLNTFSYSVQTNFYIKSKLCTTNNSKMWMAGREPHTFE